MPKFQIECKYCGSLEVRNIYTIYTIYAITQCFKCGHKELKVRTVEDLDVFGYLPKKKVKDESTLS